jgi:mRNA-degrading endonuclease toxin of MazEF toxin-antitoxin module
MNSRSTKTAISLPKELLEKIDAVVNICQILTINKTDLEQKIGTLPTEKLESVIAGIRLLIEPRSLL